MLEHASRLRIVCEKASRIFLLRDSRTDDFPLYRDRRHPDHSIAREPADVEDLLHRIIFYFAGIPGADLVAKPAVWKPIDGDAIRMQGEELVDRAVRTWNDDSEGVAAELDMSLHHLDEFERRLINVRLIVQDFIKRMIESSLF